MNDQETLTPEQTQPGESSVSVTLEAAQATVEVIDLARSAKGCTLSSYLANSIPTCVGIVSMLESLAGERETWERTELAASRNRLYSILAECYELYLVMKSPDTAKGTRKSLVDGLDMYIRQKGLKTLDKTHDMNKVVKAVFGDERRRVSAYAMALRAALTAGHEVQAKTQHVPAGQLAAWIEFKGGVEEIRLGSKNNGLSEKVRAEVARGAVENCAPLLTFKPDSKTMQFGSDDADKMMVLLVMYLPTGDLEVRSVVKSGSAVRAALAAHYTANKEELVDAKPAQAAARANATAIALSI